MKITAEIARLDRLDKNLAAVSGYADLKENWYGSGEVPFDEHVITVAKAVLSKLKVQPEVFPVRDGSIQFDFTSLKQFYLEATIGRDYYEIFVTTSDGSLDINYKTTDVDKIVDRIHKVIDANG